MLNSIKTPSVLVYFLLILLPNFALAQPPGHSKMMSKLKDGAQNRSLDELLKAVAERDGGNFDIVALRGMQSSNLSEYSSIFRQVIFDERVQKIHQSLSEMPKSDAAALISNAFKQNLKRMQERTKNGKGIESPLSYGQHVHLFLSSEFSTKQEFNSNVDDWNEWYTRQFAETLVNAKDGLATEVRLSTFDRSARPELLMYLNLVLIDQMRTGDSSKISAVLKEAGVEMPLAETFEMQLFRVDLDNPIEVPVFETWLGLGVLNTGQRMQVFHEAEKLINPKGYASSALASALANFSEFFLTLGGRIGPQDLRNAIESRPSSGTLIELLGTDATHRIGQGWRSTVPPTKANMLATIDRLTKSVPPANKEEWEKIVSEIKTWIAELPVEGIEVAKKRVWEWPKSNKDDSTDAKARLGLVLRVEMKNTHALKGAVENSNSVGDSDLRPATDRKSESTDENKGSAPNE